MGRLLVRGWEGVILRELFEHVVLFKSKSP